MNIKLLKEVQKQIRKEPRQLHMSSWFFRHESLPNCKTAACIAGWVNTIIFSRKKKKRPMPSIGFQAVGDSSGPATLELAITFSQADRLYHIHNWPSKFQAEIEGKEQFDKYSTSFTFDKLPPEQRADIACRRIDHFIATNGEE